ncbi:hypothetical protein JHD48_07210 [Sulfurimonas sp. SAG-AH-194-I05]|nr:hypothetical protein [Sulfurimonas sp. SAG-AH-194-I05]MDF1875518.1 hypothetical protein [Sulfurimonas sp. SAG-AH-194-I05]
MFDFLDEDWFIITLEIVFVILIVFDVRNYIRTKKKEYITNIVLTAGFAIWTLMPMYTKYFGWDESQKSALLSTCKGDVNVTKTCICVNDTLFKTYGYDEYNALEKGETEYKEFIKDTKEDCLDDSWFGFF